ncbi:fimbria/pilus outer membrane usher protein [Pantoea agglomerans]|uniref:fimbria/pilus outer membrane usher protein n=1 Tax=Enterobacter agglomerans TaxID=549 RepID=UPI003DA0B5D2
MSRTEEDNNIVLPITSRVRPIVLFIWIFCLAGSETAYGEQWFNPNSLQKIDDGTETINLQNFAQTGGQAPGTWRVDIFLNNNYVDNREMTFVLENGHLRPQLKVADLKAMGVKTDAFPPFAALPADETITDPGKYIPAADAVLQFNIQRLDISIPQAALTSEARGFVDPKTWDQGLPALIVNYGFSGSQTRYDNRPGTWNSHFLSLRSGANLGAWRLRNYSTWSDSGSGKSSWNSINTYLQRDIQKIKGQFTAGESATPSDVFDSVQFRGVQLASDDNMFPDSQKGFAPVIRGIAQSNAQVTVRQNGSIIYQTYVAPGAFAISDLYPTSASGNLEVTIKEADGSERRFTQTFSAAPVMLREGRFKYAITAARYRSQSTNVATPIFGQGTLIYGLPHNTTVYGGLLGAEKYKSAALGMGYSFGQLGSVSVDVTQANTKFTDDTIKQGQSYRIQYAKNINETGTSVTLAGYRYSTSGFYDFQEANELYTTSQSVWRIGHNKRSKTQLNLTQSLGDWGSIYISGYQQNYWGMSGYERNVSLGYNIGLAGINYGLSYTYSRAPGNNPTDQQFAFSIQVPLSRFLPNSWASYNLNTSKKGDTTHQAGLSGTALADNNLNYSVRQSWGNRGAGGSGSATMDYKGTYGEASAGYNYGNDSRQLNYGLQGAIVAHPYGVTLAQPLGDTIALVRAPGASGAKVLNNTGVYTDWRGYAVVPYLSTYRTNRVALDSATLGDDVDIDTKIQTVTPTQGAIVLANFKTRVGGQALISLMRRGKIVPFGAGVTLESEGEIISGIVGSDGQVYMSGLPESGKLRVQWGKGKDQKCIAPFRLPERSPGTVREVDAECL